MPAKKRAVATPAAQTQQDVAADLAAQINKVFGAGAVGMASNEDLAVKRWPTGVLPLDMLLDGGIPRGRFIEVYGPYSTLKSYWLYKALGAVQAQGGRAALIDTEHSFDPEWATALGIDVSRLLLSRPETAEQGIGVLEALVRQGYDLVGFDSIAAAIPKQHQESLPGEDNQPGALARVMSKGLARVTAANKHTSVIFINQTREKIGVTFGSPVTTSGGKAMGFYASYRISFTRTGKITEIVEAWDGEKNVKTRRVIAHKISASMEKSKLSAPNQDAWFVYDLHKGAVDDQGFLVAQGIEKGLITKSAAGHYAIPGVLDTAIHGREKFETWVAENPEVTEWLKETIIPTALWASPTSH